jgi:hypothetical protein
MRSPVHGLFSHCLGRHCHNGFDAGQRGWEFESKLKAQAAAACEGTGRRPDLQAGAGKCKQHQHRWYWTEDECGAGISTRSGNYSHGPQRCAMGGSLSGGNVTPAAEFNFCVDPEAARMVFSSEIPIRMVSLDVTRKAQLKDEHIRALQAGSGRASQAPARIAEAVMKMDRQHHDGGGPNLHDPLAVSCLIQPDILTFERYHVEIETSGNITAGESVGWKHTPLWYSAPLQTTGCSVDATAPPFTMNAKVASGVDPGKFSDLLISGFNESGDITLPMQPEDRNKS